jgi:Proprotein convertase P-domain
MTIRQPLILAASLSAAAAAPIYYPKQERANASTGFIESKVGGYWYRGSGVVARDPKLIFSCAHVFYDSGKWATDYLFYRNWHARSYPDPANGASPRGLHHFTSYVNASETVGSETNRAFASDFTVLYGNSSFGAAMPTLRDGGSAVRSTQWKRIVGYPSEIDFTGARGFTYQHSTNWFNYRSRQLRGAYHEFKDVSTGPGNSGGPIFVRNDNGSEALAGVLVSGWTRLAGVRALDLASHTMSGYALGLQDRTLTFRNTNRSNLPDGSYIARSIPVSGFDGSVAKLSVSLSVTTATRGELDIYLVSPSGKTRWIQKRSTDTTDNLGISAMDLSDAFAGANPNGTWKILIRDAAGGARGVFENGAVTISAL